jgi:hypothetical protein
MPAAGVATEDGVSCKLQAVVVVQVAMSFYRDSTYT